MAVLKPGLLKAVETLTRAWPSVASETSTLRINCRRLSIPASGALELFWTRSAVHTNTCMATGLQLQNPSPENPLPFFVATSAYSNNQSGRTGNGSGLAPPSGSAAFLYNLQYNSCIRMAENKSLATGRHYHSSSSSSSSASAGNHRDNSVEQHSQTVDELGAVCWGCKQDLPRGNLVCNSCHKVQPVNSQLNYFEVMGLPQDKFDIETAKLDARYKALQWQMHPDLSAHKPASEKEFSAQQSMVVNMAYGVLRTPLSRANYMLTLQGIKAGDSAEGTIQDPELLMEVMDAREEVESTTDAHDLMRILNSNRVSQQEVLAELSIAFAKHLLSDVVAAVTRLTYLVRLEEEVVLKLPSLDGLSTVISPPAASSRAQQTDQHQ